jgi:hypothetical protein
VQVAESSGSVPFGHEVVHRALWLGMLMSKSIVVGNMADAGHGGLPGMPVKRLIMCMSRRGMVHCSVVAGAGSAVISIARGQKLRMVNIGDFMLRGVEFDDEKDWVREEVRQM